MTKGTYSKRSSSSHINWKIIASIGIVAVVVIVGFGVGAFIIAGAPTETTPTSELATFGASSKVDGEIVSSFTPGKIWVPKDNDDISSDDDEQRKSLFEVEETDDLGDIAIDLSGYKVAWLQVGYDSETPWREQWFKLEAGNSDYFFEVHHPTSDVNFNLLDSTLNEVTTVNFSTNGNYTIIADCPHKATTELHYGSLGWERTTEDYNDYTDDEISFLQDEANFRDQSPTYILGDDTSLDYDDTWEMITNAFCFKFVANDTINTTDTSSKQINCTISDYNFDYPCEVYISGVNLYIVFYDFYNTVQFTTGAYSLPLKLEFGDDIEIDEAYSGNADIPQGISSINNFVQLSAIAS